MSFLLFASIIGSAFCHSLYNFLMHKSGGNRLFLLFMFIGAAITATIVFVIEGEIVGVEPSTLVIIYAASYLYVLYQILVAKSYESGEISRMYPLTWLSPIFVPIWAVLFLHESLDFKTLVGILMCTIGAMMMKQKSFSFTEWKLIFSKQNMHKGAGFAILASFTYSIGSVLDKARIGTVDLSLYLWILLVSMALNMTIFYVIFERKQLKEIRTISWPYVIIAGVVSFSSFYLFRNALVEIPVSIAIPIRTTSICFGLLFGVLFLQEKITKLKFISTLAIIGGIVIVSL